MKNKLIIILCCVFNFILCSFPTDEDDYSGPMEYDSFLANISINGKNDQKITYYSSNSRAVSAKMYWLGEKPLFLLYRDDLYIYNMNGEIINSIKKPANILDMDVNYDGSYAVFACNGDSAELYLFNISLLEIKKITNSPQMMERYPHFSQDGQKIVYTVQTGNAATDPYALKLYDLVADSSYTLLFSDSENMHANPFTTPCFGKNDNTIYYIYYSNALSYAGTSKLYSLDLNSREVVLIDENADGSADMKYSQIGNRLVYLTNNPYRGIRVYDATARNFFELGDRIHNECRAIGPHLILNINPQGTIVIAGTDYCNKTNIYSINIENAEYYPICLGTSPALSQDGKTILYVKTLYQ